MAYPEPILPLKGKRAQEFSERLEKFRLTARQKAMYRDARALYERRKRK
ncbi:MAG: hypothetical protein LC624_10820 [Halobacteriales archaeon]|nr:hypothetical protein [Halobacteriales archaeon]